LPFFLLSFREFLLNRALQRRMDVFRPKDSADRAVKKRRLVALISCAWLMRKLLAMLTVKSRKRDKKSAAEHKRSWSEPEGHGRGTCA
jgi:hypothetical protein